MCLRTESAEIGRECGFGCDLTLAASRLGRKMVAVATASKTDDCSGRDLPDSAGDLCEDCEGRNLSKAPFL